MKTLVHLPVAVIRELSVALVFALVLALFWYMTSGSISYREALRAASQPGAFPCKPTGLSVPDLVRSGDQPFGDALDHEMESAP